MINDELARYRARDLDAVIFLDHREREIDRRRHSRRGPDRTIDDVYAILLDRHGWKLLTKLLREIPMGGCAATIKHARLSKRKCSVARSRNPARGDLRAPIEFHVRRVAAPCVVAFTLAEAGVL